MAMQKSRKDELQKSVALAIGMQVLVTLNIKMDLDLANGAHATIISIILHQSKQISNSSIVHLQYMPPCVLIRMEQTRAGILLGLDEGVIPIELVTKTFKISYDA